MKVSEKNLPFLDRLNLLSPALSLSESDLNGHRSPRRYRWSPRGTAVLVIHETAANTGFLFDENGMIVSGRKFRTRRNQRDAVIQR